MAKQTSDRESRARLRTYQARTQVHETQVRRRKRDNTIASVSVVLVFALAVVGQLWYFGQGPGAQPSSSASAAAGVNVGSVPDSTIAAGRDWYGTADVNAVPISFTLAGALAPQAVSSEIDLINKGFYANNNCHRLTTTGIYVLQCGSVDGNGGGDLGYSYGPVENAPADNFYPAGTIAMARQGNNSYSHTSQIFIVYKDSMIPADAAGGYTVIGHITSGLEALQALIASTGVSSATGSETPASPIVLSNVKVQ